jgi:hypothetical protein
MGLFYLIHAMINGLSDHHIHALRMQLMSLDTN